MLEYNTKAKQAFKSASYSASLIPPHTSGVPTSAAPLPPSRDINSVPHWASWQQREKQKIDLPYLLPLLFASLILGEGRSSNTVTTWCEESTHWKRHWCWERLRRRGWQRMKSLHGITDSMDMSLSNSRRHWRTGKPGKLQSMGVTRSQTWGSAWTTETLPTHWDLLIWRRGPCSVSLTWVCGGGSPYHGSQTLPGHSTWGKLPTSARSGTEISFLLSPLPVPQQRNGNTSCFSWLKTEGQLPPDPVSTQDDSQSITGFCKAGVGWRINLIFCFSETMRKGTVVLWMFEYRIYYQKHFLCQATLFLECFSKKSVPLDGSRLEDFVAP